MKKRIALTHGVIYTGFQQLVDHAILVEGDTITGIVPHSAIPSEYEQVNVHGNFVCPGLVDLQIYGTGKHLFSAELTEEALHTIERELLLQGCTSFYLTLATNTLELFEEAITIFKSAKPEVALGLHLEGPFLNSAKRGAHPAELVRVADRAMLSALMDNDEGVVKMMTIAPEFFSDDCITYLIDKKVLLSAGHSNASAAQARAAFDKGVRAVTHLWNAMSPFHHREVGLPGAVFNHNSVSASIIVDGIHVDYEAVRLSKQIMGERLFLITDAVAECDKGIYKHQLNGDHYVLPDGTLSGSALTLLKAIQNSVLHADIPLQEAIRMATLYPADLINRKDIGRLEAGAIANILVFNTDFEVVDVYFQGDNIKQN